MTSYALGYLREAMNRLSASSVKDRKKGCQDLTALLRKEDVQLGIEYQSRLALAGKFEMRHVDRLGVGVPTG